MGLPEFSILNFNRVSKGNGTKKIKKWNLAFKCSKIIKDLGVRSVWEGSIKEKSSLTIRFPLLSRDYCMHTDGQVDMLRPIHLMMLIKQI